MESMKALKDGVQKVKDQPTFAETETMSARYIHKQTYAEFYETYVAWSEEKSELPACRTMFEKVFKEKWEHRIKFRSKTEHARCTTCARIHQQVRNAVSNEEAERFRQDLMGHLKGTFQDRGVYAMFSAASVECTAGGVGRVPDESSVLAMCLDGMDQAKFKIPRNLQNTKQWEDAGRPTAHLIGCLIHGVGEACWISDADLPKNASLTCELISRALGITAVQLKERGVSMPKHLYVQVENISRETRT